MAYRKKTEYFFFLRNALTVNSSNHFMHAVRIKPPIIAIHFAPYVHWNVLACFIPIYWQCYAFCLVSASSKYFFQIHEIVLLKLPVLLEMRMHRNSVEQYWTIGITSSIFIMTKIDSIAMFEWKSIYGIRENRLVIRTNKSKLPIKSERRKKRSMATSEKWKL